MSLTVYLSGEIHTGWREEIRQGAANHDLDIDFMSAITDHEASDVAGDRLGEEAAQYWRDHKSAKVNAIRTKTLIEKAIWPSTDLGISTNSGMQPSMQVTVLRPANHISPCMQRILSIL